MSRYHYFSKSALYAVVGSLPLLLAYEVLILLGNTAQFEVRNAADVLLRTLLGAAGLSPNQAYLAMILALILSIPFVRNPRVELEPRYFAYMLVEAFAYSLLLGFAINLLLQPLLTATLWPVASNWQSAFHWTSALNWQPASHGLPASHWPLALPAQSGWKQLVAQSLGAGLFEEFLFRVLLLNALLGLTRLMLAEWLGVLVSILGASFLFALAHYIGPLGDPLRLDSFLFRWLAGLLFTVLYYSRGFAVTAYAHALYDIRVLMFS
jgi:membrane protease YdiL (CAAX protease family)